MNLDEAIDNMHDIDDYAADESNSNESVGEVVRRSPVAAILAAMQQAKAEIDEQNEKIAAMLLADIDMSHACQEQAKTITAQAAEIERLTASLNTANEVNDAHHASKFNLSTYALTLSEDNFNLTMSGLDVVTRDCIKSLTARLEAAEKVASEAAQSLHTIATQSGRTDLMEEMSQVRAYAYNRCLVANEALPAHRAAKGGEA